MARPPASGCSGCGAGDVDLRPAPGTAARQASMAQGQRGAKEQPGGMARRLGTMPGMVGSGVAGRLQRGGLAELRHRSHQADGVGVARVAEHLARPGRSRRSRPAYITATRSAISATTPRLWVTNSMPMPRSCLQLLQQVEDLGLDRHVERGGRLVGDQQHRIAGERHGDGGALAHAARELVRVLPGAPRRVGDADLGEQVDRGVERRVACARAEMDADRLGDLVADGVDRVEAGHRLLEHHGDVVAADAAQRLRVERRRGRALWPSLPRNTHASRRRSRRPCWAEGRMIDRLVTDLPEPDSPTSATVSPGAIDRSRS